MATTSAADSADDVLTSTPGWCSRSSAMMLITGSSADDDVAATSTRPAAPLSTVLAAARSASRSRSTSLARSTTSSPALLSTALRPTRWNSATPSSCSSLPIARDRDGCATRSARAACVKPPCSTMATKYSS